MEKKKTPLSIKVIYWFSMASLGIMALTTLFVLAINIGHYSNSFKFFDNMHTGLSATFEYPDAGTLELDGETFIVNLSEATPKIHFENTPDAIKNRVFPAMLLATLIGLLLNWLVFKFCRNVYQLKIFDLGNIKILKQIAYTLLGLWLYIMIYARLFYYMVERNINFESLELSFERPEAGGLLMGALGLWALAHIFKHGLSLKQENELTI